MELEEFINKVKPHGIHNSAPPKTPLLRHEWESKLLYSVYDRLGDSCCVLDYGCGSNGTLQHTLLNHFPNSTYYGFDLIEDYFADSRGFGEKEEGNVHLLDIKKFDNILPIADCMILGSIFTHLGLNSITDILDKTLPYYDKGFHLCFTSFLSNEIIQYHKGRDDYWWIVTLTIDWIKEYCDKHDLNFIVQPYVFELDHKIHFDLTYQSFITIFKK
jgi:hypothetical protein